MKTLIKLFFLGVLTVLLSFAAMAKPYDEVIRASNSKTKSLFVIKADKNFIGARVAVIHANGKVLTEQVLQRRKVIIDFDAVKAGSYTIVVEKDGYKKEFIYTKQ